MQTAIRDGYHLFAWNDGEVEQGCKLYDLVLANLSAIKKHYSGVLQEGRLAIHTFTSQQTIEEDMQSLEGIVKYLGNVHWCVSSIGLNVSESLHGRELEVASGVTKLMERYGTGPTATLDVLGEKLCEYIAHGKPKGGFGITFNPYYGAVQTCPYHSELSTTNWLNLREYLDFLKGKDAQITDQHVKRWMNCSISAEKKLTAAIYEVAGYEPCLMRHSRKHEVDSFIAKVNLEMTQKQKAEGLDCINPQYFSRILARLEEAIKSLGGDKKRN